jgi:hypothetical protein
MNTPERIPLTRVIVTLDPTWSVPGFRLPDGRVIFPVPRGGIRADTEEAIHLTHPDATITVVEEPAPDGH